MSYTATVADIAMFSTSDPKELELEKHVMSRLFDSTQEHKDPEPILRRFDKTAFTKGNFSCITGQAKSRKTSLIVAIVGAYLAGEYMEFEAQEAPGTVLYCDTEQSEGHVSRVVKRIQRIAGLPQNQNSDILKVLVLREDDPEMRKKSIGYAIKKWNPSLIVIDGISDLFLNGVNDEKESIEISGMLLQLTSEYNCHIITALHTNPGSDKARGHAGSEIARKAETVLNVTKDGDSSLVEAKQCRDMDLDSFAFTIFDGLPALCEIQNQKPATQKLKEGFANIFSGVESLYYTELVRAVCSEFHIKEPTAKEKVRKAVESQSIDKVDSLYKLHKDFKSDTFKDAPF